jgi:nucleoside-diphosphate-sugar epimerase
MSRLLIFGLGYTAGHIAAALRAEGWQVTGTRRTSADGTIAFDDSDAVRAAIADATHILSSVPPDEGVDPVLVRYGDDLAQRGAAWTGYLSSTGVYGDAAGAWVDESTPIGSGRRAARALADAAWQALTPNVRVFRLPGIYGPGRSPLDRIRAGRAHRIDLPGQVFSRVHVDDIVAGVRASFTAPAGAYNLSDDLPASQNAVIDYGCALIGIDPLPLMTLEQARLSEMALGFYRENRRVANGKAKRMLGWRPLHPTYRSGLRALAGDGA